MAVQMDEAALKEWILRRLGAPILKVELTECHLQDAINYAKDWFAAKKGIKKWATWPIYSNESEYTLPDEVDVILDVAFPVPPYDLSLVFSPFTLIDDKVPYDVFAAPSSIGVYSSFTQTLQFNEMAKRVLSSDTDWRQEDRKLHIFPIPNNNGYMLVHYKSNAVPIEQLSARDFDLIKRYALARAKEDLGRIRSKYDGVPTAAGTTSLDGSTLLSEAQTEIAALEEEIGEAGKPMMWDVG